MGKKNAKNKSRRIDMSTAVSPQEKSFLLQGKLKIPISARYATPHSVLFQYLKDQPATDPEKPVRLLVQNNGESVELGPCRISRRDDSDGYSGRLFFMDDIYDLWRLFFQNKLNALQTPFHDVPRISARKETVRPAFKNYTADLHDDLTAYKRMFDGLDREYHNEPENKKALIQNTIIKLEGKIFKGFLQDQERELIHQVADFNPKEHQVHGDYFREQLREFVFGFPFGARSLLKPRGFAGDSELMRMIYLNDYQGDTTFAKLLHKQAVEHGASQSVRNRTALIARMVNDFQSRCGGLSADRLKVLSVGCGPAFELENIFRYSENPNSFIFSLFDQDPAALHDAAHTIRGVEKKLGIRPAVDYVRGSVRTMLFSRRFKQEKGQFDFIYIMGLLDYLSFRVGKAVLDRLYNLLKPGGELVAGNFHVSNQSRYKMEYWGDWILIHRTEADFREMFENDGTRKVSIFFEDTGNQRFLHIQKP